MPVPRVIGGGNPAPPVNAAPPAVQPTRLADIYPLALEATPNVPDLAGPPSLEHIASIVFNPSFQGFDKDIQLAIINSLGPRPNYYNDLGGGGGGGASTSGPGSTRSASPAPGGVAGGTAGSFLLDSSVHGSQKKSLNGQAIVSHGLTGIL